jgi:hypothetical protein
LIIEKIDGDASHAIELIFKWIKDGRVSGHVSNRVFEHDTERMDECQVDQVKVVLEEHGIPINGSSFRLDFSLIGGLDVLDGPVTERTPEEIEKFQLIVGPDPSSLPPSAVGSRMPNKLGDYDSLFDHWLNRRDYFITLDGKDYLHVNKRQGYRDELNLLVVSPEEYVQQHSDWIA